MPQPLSKERKNRIRRVYLWMATLVVGFIACMLVWHLDYLLNRTRVLFGAALQGMAYDMAMTRHARDLQADRHVPPAIVVLAITDKTYEQLEAVPNTFPGVPDKELDFRRHGRLFHAAVLENLRKAGTRVVTFDVVFRPEDPEQDPHFAAAIRRHGRVVLAGLDEPGVEQNEIAERLHELKLPVPDLREPAAGVGVANVETDFVDRTVRFLNWWRIGMDEETTEDVPVPALSVAAAALYEGRNPRTIIQEEVQPKSTFLGRRIVWLDRRAASSYVRFIGTANAAFRIIPYEHVFNLGRDPEVEYVRPLLKDKLVIVGDTSLSGQDIHRVPVASPRQHLHDAHDMPGVELQAHLTNAVLTGDYVEAASPTARFMLLLISCVFVAIVGRALTPVKYLAVVTVLLLIVWWASIRLLSDRGYWLEPVTASAGMVTAVILEMGLVYVVERRERTKVRRQLGRHVGPRVADALLDNEWPDLSGESAEITMLFSDLQGFTTLSETMTSHEICTLLNQYFGVIFPVLDRWGGTVDKLMGDGMMAYFGWPKRHPDAAARAIRCAVEIQEALRAWQARPENAGLPPLKTRIGIHTGPATVGEIGSGGRAEFTVIGDVVNVASRLEGMNKEFGTTILVSEATREVAGDVVPMIHRGTAVVRGRKEPIGVYSVEPDGVSPSRTSATAGAAT